MEKIPKRGNTLWERLQPRIFSADVRQVAMRLASITFPLRLCGE